ncbi:hypothetical protein K7I13_12335 [Brucepastera parasyntrophica]|uniref:hypothetical protein n=1 Tax=Brucepastera parasyntrophica TaxID=2880008 RepID=UPI002109F872|nr:hypothetical protein [Brucepastera parasyntrophica]ULQ59270.1 hypothetical protein K7I13_12335 [Brucepastera parasyntrophica]
MRADFGAGSKQIFAGNILFVLCCVFYLVWWLLASKPVGPIKGMRSGWLLIPACITGLAGVILIVRGIRAEPVRAALFPVKYLLWGGAAAYLVLLAVTLLLFKRPITTELLLIVGWVMLALAEVNALYGAGRFSLPMSLVLSIVTGVMCIFCIVCYVLYYRLDNRAGYIDGILPLLMAALVMAGISAGMVIGAVKQ